VTLLTARVYQIFKRRVLIITEKLSSNNASIYAEKIQNKDGISPCLERDSKPCYRCARHIGDDDCLDRATSVIDLTCVPHIIGKHSETGTVAAGS
jgi:hypothetical protein